MKTNTVITITLLILIAVITSFLPAQQASAATKTWTGLIDDKWSNPDNWAPVGVPVSSDTIIIDGLPIPNTFVYLDTDFILNGSMTIHDHDWLWIQSGITFINEGTIYNEGDINNEGTFENIGTIDSWSISNYDTFSNYGTINTYQHLGNKGIMNNW